MCTVLGASPPCAEPRNETGNSGRYLVVSPYTEIEHCIDLSTLDPEGRLLAESLAKFASLRADYATAPYRDTFNWGEVMADLKIRAKEQDYLWRETSFYIVVFRSRIPPTTDYGKLGEMDKAAHAEAMVEGGLLKYWFGSPDRNGRNLATCVWRSREHSLIAGTGPEHAKAVRATKAMYTEWGIERYSLVISDRLASWEIRDWSKEHD